MIAVAEGPVPFKALMQTAGTQPSVPSITDAKDQSTAIATQPAHKTPMTSGGKIMTGVGIGFVAIGVVVIVGTAGLSGWASSSDRDKLYGVGGGLIAGGVTLVVFGHHQRSK